MFQLTRNPLKAFFILEDGSMISMYAKKIVKDRFKIGRLKDDWRDRYCIDGEWIDHCEFFRVLETKGTSVTLGKKGVEREVKYVESYMKETNTIRMFCSPKALYFSFYRKKGIPTEAQWRRLRQIVEYVAISEIHCDLYEDAQLLLAIDARSINEIRIEYARALRKTT